MTGSGGSLFEALPSGPLPDELFTTLVTVGAVTVGAERARTVRVERIVSSGQSSPDGFWYDQDWDEFVLLVQGAAGLVLAGDGATGEVTERRLGPGDWAMIPAHTRHRVAWTDPDGPTVWLAVHIGEPQDPP